MGPPGAPFRLGPGAKCPSCPPPVGGPDPEAKFGLSMTLKSLQIDCVYYWRALCEVPAHYTPLSQSHGHSMAPISHSWL